MLKPDKVVSDLALCQDALAQAEQTLSVQNSQFDLVMEHLSLGLAMFNAQGQLTFANKRLRGMAKFGEDVLQSKLSYPSYLQLLLQSLGALSNASARIEALASLAKSSNRASVNLIFASGQVLRISHGPLGDKGFVQTLEDVTERRKAEAQASHLASHDALTGLPTRRLLKQHIHVALSDAKADCAVLCLDLDRFKSVNDSLGHAAGDLVLVEVAKRLSQCLSAGDIVGRLGGNQFVVLKASAESSELLSQLAQSLITEVTKPFEIMGQSVLVGANIGVAVAPRDGASADRLIKSADMALFESKRNGRGHFSFFDPVLERRALERQSLENDLRLAIAEDQFELHFQPYYAARQRKLMGFEALIRWNHPTRGRVSPVDFIPIAEELGLIVELGDFVIRRACLAAASWPKDLMISVNVSTRQLINHDLVKTVDEALASSGLPAKRLEVEITESALMENIGEVAATLEKLRTRGIGLAMDDFGTGYSSLAYLRKFNFSKVKIDRSFINDLETENQSIAIVRAIIALCRNLNIDVTAEGVETELQADILRLENCDYLQGYLFGKPTPQANLAEKFFNAQKLQQAVTPA